MKIIFTLSILCGILVAFWHSIIGRNVLDGFLGGFLGIFISLNILRLVAIKL